MNGSGHRRGILMIAEGFSPNIGGLETHEDDLCRYLDENGYPVFVATYRPLTTRARAPIVERKGGIEIRRMPWVGYNLRHKLESMPPILLAYLVPGLFLNSLWVLLRHGKQIDTIHAHGLAPALAGNMLKGLFRKRLVVSTHTIYGLRPGTYLARGIRWILTSSDMVLPLAEISRKELAAAGVPERKLKTYTHWVNLDVFKPAYRAGTRKELGLEGKFVCLFIGRFIEKKGIVVLLEAAGKVNPSIVFLFVGDGPLKSRVDEMSKSLPNIVCVGNVANEKTPAYYNAADLMLLPSMYEEGFGRVAAESLACGVPVIASNRGSLPELIRPNVGRVLEMSADKLAAVLTHLYEHPEEMDRMRACCRGYATEHFSERNAIVITAAYAGGNGDRATCGSCAGKKPSGGNIH